MGARAGRRRADEHQPDLHQSDLHRSDQPGDGRSRFDRLPKPARIGLALFVGVAVVFAVKVAPDLFFADGSTGQWVYLGGMVVLAGVGVVISLRLQGRRLGGNEQGQMFRHALKDGVVPAQADRQAWQREAHGVLHQQRRIRRLQVPQTILLGLLAIVVVGLVVIADLPSSARATFAVLAAALVGVDFLGRGVARRNRDRAQRLVDVLS